MCAIHTEAGTEQLGMINRHMQRMAMHIIYDEAWLTLLVEVYTDILRHEVPALHLGALHLPLPEVDPGLHRCTTILLEAVDGLEHEALLIGANGCRVTHMHCTTGMTPQHSNATIARTDGGI